MRSKPLAIILVFSLTALAGHGFAADDDAKPGDRAKAPAKAQARNRAGNADNRVLNNVFRIPPGTQLTEQQKSKLEALRAKHGKELAAKVRDLQRKENFRYNLTNGAIWHAIIDGQKAPVRSLLVLIPKANGENY